MTRFYLKTRALAVLLLPCWCTSFLIQPRHVTKPLPSIGSLNCENRFQQMIARRTLLRMGDDDSDSTAPKRKRKRKRKVAQTPEANDEANPATEEEKPAIELKAREDSPVELKVQDVREIMGGSVSASSSSAPVRSSSSSENASATDELSTTLPTSVSSASPPSSRFKNDSMEQLLADARRMREEEAEVEEDGEQSGSIKATIGKGLSAIVTADFFVVMAFLVWFLVGIFSSSILKNDTIQIAFNNNFELLVQPALGILMIGSIAGNFFKEDEE